MERQQPPFGKELRDVGRIPEEHVQLRAGGHGRGQLLHVVRGRVVGVLDLDAWVRRDEVLVERVVPGHRGRIVILVQIRDLAAGGRLGRGGGGGGWGRGRGGRRCRCRRFGGRCRRCRCAGRC